MITPTPTPSDTLTNTSSLGIVTASARSDHICASAQARPEFSIWTGSPVAAESASRRCTSRQPSVGACSTRIVACSTMPGTTTPIPAQVSTSGCSASSFLMRVASASTTAFGSRLVGNETMPVSGLPTRSASIRKVWLERMSAATTARRRESM